MVKVLVLIYTILFSNALFGKSCQRNEDITYKPEGKINIGKISITNRYSNGECNLIIKTSRLTSDGQKISEQYTISDRGKLFSFVGSQGTYLSSNNSRATGNRTYYLLPRKEENVSYEVMPNSNIKFKMANGETLLMSSKTGEVLDITNIRWRKDKALRSYIKNGRIVAQDVFSNNCLNCGLKYKDTKYDKFEYSEGGLDIISSETGHILDTGFWRGKDARSPKLWGKDVSTTIVDKNGLKCKIRNKYLYSYTYEEYPNRNGVIVRSVDLINIKFKDDNKKFPTRIGMLETFPEFLERVCVKNKKIKNFDVTTFNILHKNCESCELPGKEGMSRADQFGSQILKILDK